MKKVLLIVAIVVLVGGAFFGGTLFARSSSSAPADFAAGARGANGPFADMTEEERAEMMNMTDEERQAFLEEQGIDAGTMPGGGGGGPMRGGLLEGEVVEVADDAITVALTNGGSQTVYTDEETIVAYAEDATELATGSQVLLFSASEADGVTTAQAIVVY